MMTAAILAVYTHSHTFTTILRVFIVLILIG